MAALMKTISFQLLFLIQSRRPSWVVWGAAGLAFLVGLALLVYFVTRLRKGETEPDDGWGAAKGSLLLEGDQPPARPRDTSVPSPLAGTLATTPSPGAAPTPSPVTTEALPVSSQHEAPAVQASAESASAASHGDVGETAETEADSAVLDEHVWAELDAAKEPRPEPTETYAEPTKTPLEPSELSAEIQPPRPARALFEPPKIEPIAPRRESYEPPAILPIVPRQSSPAQRERGPAPSARSTFQQTSKVATAATVAGRTADTPREPIKLGSSSSGRAPGALGIGSLSNYGQPPDDESKTYTGTIALVVAVALIGGAVLAYLYVPRFHGWVDNLKMKARGETPAPQETQPQAKVKIFPQRAQVEKNQIRASGYVFNNTADEVLKGLTVELALTKSDGSTETVSAAVKPDELQPGQQGYAGRASYEVVYDGKKYTGYKVLRVLSNGTEVSYAMVKMGS